MSFLEIKGEGRRLAALLFSIGVLQVAGYYLAASLVNGPDSLATPQPDTLLYCQAARRIVAGHAFSFSPGTAVSTGTTSVLYPFVLAIPVALGCLGGALLTAGFWLNAGFYLVFLAGWSVAFRKWAPVKTSALAIVLLAVFPQTAYSALAQSDTGLWMAVSGLLAAALASGWRFSSVALLSIGPWVRPEGAIVIVAFAMIVFWLRRWRDLWMLALAALSLVGLFWFNGHLTGSAGFSSVAAKGFFNTMSFPEALRTTAVTLVTMCNDLFLGRAGSFPRGLYAIPMFGAIAFAIGVGVFSWMRNQWALGVLSLSAAGSLLVVAQSGWEGSNSDRYLAWIMPLIVFFSALGWDWCRQRLSGFRWARFLTALPVGYSVAASCVMIGVYGLACDQTEKSVRFAKEIDRIIPTNASIGSTQFSGLAYYWGDRHVANLSGIYSPEFSAKNVFGLVEILKNEPSTRVDYWMFSPLDAVPATLLESCGKSVLSGPDATVLKKMDWTAFDRAATVPAVAGKTLRDRVDVCYGKDEKRARYEIVFNYGMRPFEELLEVADLNGKEGVDCGRLVAGYDEMDVSGLTPGRDVTVVLRLADHAQALNRGYFGDVYKTEYSFRGENGFHVAVDGVDVLCTHLHIERKGLSDLKLTIPSKFITSARHRVRFHGDHAAFGYWYYQ